MSKEILFFDTEFTGLHKDTTLISIGIVSTSGKTFYAELVDYDVEQIDDWLKTNVLDNLIFTKTMVGYKGTNGANTYFNGTHDQLKPVLTEWLSQFGDKDNKTTIWSDCLAYDWVLFNNIFGHAFNIPDNILYIPMDLCTLLSLRNIDPDASREDLCGNSVKGKKHNALYDAEVIKAIYYKII